jgi:hypothetical protein
MKNPECSDFKYLGGATVYSHDKLLSEYYDHRTQCQITFKAENEGWKLVLRFEYLDSTAKTDDYYDYSMCKVIISVWTTTTSQ